MEKRTPHCRLTEVKTLMAAGKVRATHSARLGATGLGFQLSDMLAVVTALTAADFYKSMSTHADFTVWQDVYSPARRRATVIDDVLIVSFKEL
jgi:motility quorum-sensing regulator/GCU-specific mRNA interferase toxin